MIVTEAGVMIRVKAKDISSMGRSTQGVKIMNLGADDHISAVARLVARKKKAAKFDTSQGTLDLASAGARDEDDPIDIGGEEQMDESIVDDE
jgi:DNA gyrase subunit A